jgi:hypothetical protein
MEFQAVAAVPAAVIHPLPARRVAAPAAILSAAAQSARAFRHAAAVAAVAVAHWRSAAQAATGRPLRQPPALPGLVTEPAAAAVGAAELPAPLVARDRMG